MIHAPFFSFLFYMIKGVYIRGVLCSFFSFYLFIESLVGTHQRLTKKNRHVHPASLLSSRNSEKEPFIFSPSTQVIFFFKGFVG